MTIIVRTIGSNFKAIYKQYGTKKTNPAKEWAWYHPEDGTQTGTVK
jgi:hypothetical protein